jgi:hypothetical protein
MPVVVGPAPPTAAAITLAGPPPPPALFGRSPGLPPYPSPLGRRPTQPQPSPAAFASADSLHPEPPMAPADEMSSSGGLVPPPLGYTNGNSYAHSSPNHSHGSVASAGSNGGASYGSSGANGSSGGGSRRNGSGGGSGGSGGFGANGTSSISDSELVALARREIEASREARRNAGTADTKEVQPGITIDLCHKNIQRLPEEVIDVIKDEIERLALGHNQVATFPDRLAECVRLRYLNVRYNALREFPSPVSREQLACA